MLTGMQPGQPHWLFSSLGWGARLANGNLGFWDTLFGLTQVAIGLGLLFRPTVKLALAGSFVWGLIVWWFGEAFGMLFATLRRRASLTGAPGAVLLYGLIGLIVWPNGRPGGLLGARGARIAWAVLWGGDGMAVAARGPNSSANAIHDAISAAPSGMSWLEQPAQPRFATAAKGNGFLIALVLARSRSRSGSPSGSTGRPELFLARGRPEPHLLGRRAGLRRSRHRAARPTPTRVLLFVLLACAVYSTLPGPRSRTGPP